MFRRTLSRVALAAMCGVSSLALVACVQERTDIPSGAQEMTSGNQRITFTSTEPGTVLVEDMNTQSIVYRGRLAAGDSIIVDPSQNAVTLNGTVVTDKALHAGDEYRILFDNTVVEHAPI